MKILSASHVAVRGKVEIDGHGVREIVDMSSLGVIVRDPDRGLRVGSSLDFDLRCPQIEECPLRMSGMLDVHLEVEGLGVSAIEFVRVNPAHRRVLKNFIEVQTRRLKLPRVAIDGEVRIKNHEAMPVVDLSETGILVDAKQSLAPGAVVHFTLASAQLPGAPLTMAGVVLRSHPVGNVFQIVIEMIRINPAQRDILKEMITAALQRGNKSR